MYITIKSAYGTEVTFEFDEDDLSPDGMNTRLREVGDAFRQAVAVDGIAAVGIENLPVAPESI